MLTNLVKEFRLFIPASRVFPFQTPCSGGSHRRAVLQVVRGLSHHHVHHLVRPHAAQRPRRGHPRIVPGAQEVAGRQDVAFDVAQSCAEEALDLVVAVQLEEGRGGRKEGRNNGLGHRAGLGSNRHRQSRSHTSAGSSSSGCSGCSARGSEDPKT